MFSVREEDIFDDRCQLIVLTMLIIQLGNYIFYSPLHSNLYGHEERTCVCWDYEDCGIYMKRFNVVFYLFIYLFNK